MLKAHKVKTAYTEQFWTLFYTKRFVLCCYPSLIIQGIKISREHELGENVGSLLGPQSLNGVALVQLSQHKWYLQSFLSWKLTTRYAIYSTFERFCFHHGENTKLHWRSSSSTAITMISSGTLGPLRSPFPCLIVDHVSEMVTKFYIESYYQVSEHPYWCTYYQCYWNVAYIEFGNVSFCVAARVWK